MLVNSQTFYAKPQSHPSTYGCSLFDRKADRSTIHFHYNNSFNASTASPTSPSQMLSIKDCGNNGYFSTWKISPQNATTPSADSKKQTPCKVVKPTKMIKERTNTLQKSSSLVHHRHVSTTNSTSSNKITYSHKCYQIERKVLSAPQQTTPLLSESILQEFLYALELNQQSNLMQQRKL